MDLKVNQRINFANCEGIVEVVSRSGAKMVVTEAIVRKVGGGARKFTVQELARAATIEFAEPISTLPSFT